MSEPNHPAFDPDSIEFIAFRLDNDETTAMIGKLHREAKNRLERSI